MVSGRAAHCPSQSEQARHPDHETAALGRRVTPRRTQTVSLALKDTSPQNAEDGAGNIGHACLWNEQRALCR